MTDELVVRHQGEEVGRIRQDTDGGLVFTYAEAWLTSGFALARGLPLVTGPQPTDYFANLLPEDRARARIAISRRRARSGNTMMSGSTGSVSA